MNKEYVSDKICKTRQIIKKIIPSHFRRESSLERKNFRVKKRINSIGIYPENNNIVNNIENLNTKSAINLLMPSANENYMSKKEFKINKKSNTKNNVKVINGVKNEKIKREHNYTDIKIILENRDKAKTFNRQTSNQQLKVFVNKKNNNLFQNNQKNNLPKERSGVFKINKQKLLNENMNTYTKINNRTNIYENKCVLNQVDLAPSESKRNTDSIIQNKRRVNAYKRVDLKSNNIKYKENPNHRNINERNNLINLIYNNTHYINNKKEKSNRIINIKSPIAVYNNNISIDKNSFNKTNNFEVSLRKRKNIDINLDYQTDIKDQINNNMNKTTTKVKLKTSGFMINIEMDKDKDYLHLTENNSLLKTKSKAKLKNSNDSIKKSESDNKNKNIIKINKSKLPLFIRKCGSVNENKNVIFNFNKNKINEVSSKNLTEENQLENTIERDINQFEKTIDKDDIYKNKNEIIKNDNFCQKEKNEPIVNKNTFNTNVESSFATLNFYNSNIDENNNNEPRNNFVNEIRNYNFINKIHGDENNMNINNNAVNGNAIDNKYSNNNNDIGEIFKNISDIIKRTVMQKIPRIPILNENKNVYNNLNNYSNCNTGITSNNNFNNQNNYNYNDKKIKEYNEINTKNNKIKNNLKKNEVNNQKKIEFSTQKPKIENNNYDTDEIYNEKNKKELIKNKILNSKNIEEKDLSLDKSASLRMFPIVHEDFIEKEDEVIKLLNAQSPSESNDRNIYPSPNNEEESEIIFQNSEYSKEISLMNNELSKYNSLVNSKNAYQKLYNSNISSNMPNPNINIDNVGLKDTSIISNFGIKVCKSLTQAGKERTGHRKKNQDFFIIEKNVNNILGFNLFAVLDGHGENGHMVSQFASKFLIKKFTNITSEFRDTESIYDFLKKSDYQKIIDIFLETDNQIINQKGFDTILSGTTCVLVIQLNEHLICPNIGDSRAILIYDDNKIFELSHDSKPEIPEETKRINMLGGVVDQVVNALGEKTGPYRVYIKDQDQPGLAMSRSFGDKKAKSCGVIPYPDIIEYTIKNDSKYLVICSDGVWEFLSNEEVMEIGNKYYIQNDINEFCSQIIKKSTEIWECEENYIDDITIVAVFL